MESRMMFLARKVRPASSQSANIVEGPALPMSSEDFASWRKGLQHVSSGAGTMMKRLASFVAENQQTKAAQASNGHLNGSLEEATGFVAPENSAQNGHGGKGTAANGHLDGVSLANGSASNGHAHANGHANGNISPGSLADGRTYFVGSKKSSPGLLGLLASIRLELDEEPVRCLYDSDNYGLSVEDMLRLAEPRDLVYNVFKCGVNGMYHYFPTTASELVVTKSYGEAQAKALSVAVPGKLSSLHWEAVTPPNPDSGWNISCSVICNALNFKDVMLAFGKLPAEMMGDGAIGLEFAGTLDKAAAVGGVTYPAGTRVMGLARQAFATKVMGHEYGLWKVPDSWTAEDASTVSAVYATVYYGLVQRGGLWEGASVLIHSAAGAVGLAALRVCLNRNCQVFATVGSDAKKAYLLDLFPQLCAEDIGDSHSTSFERLVLARTDGKGVDFVLNSLDKEKLQASVRCLSTFGTLVEIGKADMISGSQLPMRPMLNSISYIAIDLWTVFGYGRESVNMRQVKQLHQLMDEGIRSGEVVPLPYRLFEIQDLEEAMRYLLKGENIGKAVLKMQAAGREAIAASGWQKELKLNWAPMPGTSHILAGGLGGFGLALGTWLVQKGATHLLLTSRTGIKHGFQQRVISSWRASGARVVVSTLDVSDPEQAQEVVRQAATMAPVSGIYHLALAMNDCLLNSMSHKQWGETVNTKALAALNLDQASRGQPVEAFVMFSSLLTYRGNKGQTNYGYGNAAAEAVVEERRAAGLPGVAIQWGSVGDVGWLADHERESAFMHSHKMQPQPIDECISTLAAILAAPRERVPAVVTVFAQPPAQTTAQTSDKQDLVTAVLRIMGLSEEDMATYSLAQLGMDSLQNIEIRATIQSAIFKPFPLEEVGALNVQQLQKLQEQASGAVLTA
eukprot:jgi/Botrbrau1/12562/Bobra.0169s0097.1